VSADVSHKAAAQTTSSTGNVVYKFEAQQESSKHHNYWKVVCYPADSDPASATMVVEIRSDDGGLTMQARAKKIADRLNDLESEPNWYMQMTVRPEKDEYVIQPPHPTAAIPWVITADVPSMDASVITLPRTTKKLANRLLDEIQDYFRVERSAPTSSKADKISTIENREKSPEDWRMLGERYEDQGKIAQAEHAYQQAISTALKKQGVDYIEADIELAGIYVDENEPESAITLLKKARGHVPSTVQTKEISDLLTRAAKP
jgi:tetratricopeptide (TPR) repeat protein